MLVLNRKQSYPDFGFFGRTALVGRFRSALRRAEAVRARSCGAARAGKNAKAAAADRADRLVRTFA
jgi:hypothetical protein